MKNEKYNYELGSSYEQYLKVDDIDSQKKTKVTLVIEKPYGYMVRMFNNYVTKFYLKITINSDNSAKINWRVEKNYHPTERFTTYYTPEKKEIIGDNNKHERSIYN